MRINRILGFFDRSEMMRKAWIFLAILGFANGCVTIPSEDIENVTSGQTYSVIGDYRIGAGDLLSVQVFGEESLSGEYTVAPSGGFQFPLVGFVSADGLTQVELARQLEKSLKPYLKTVRVAVGLTSSESFQVFFSGEVRERGAQKLNVRMSLLQGIILAGGPTDFADGRVFLIRKNKNGKVLRYQTSYNDLIRGDKGSDQIFLERGDIVHLE